MTKTKKATVAGGAAALVAVTALLLNQGEPVMESHGLWWEHNGQFTPGFVVELTTNLSTFEQIGFVAVTNVWRTNASGFAYHFPLTNEPPLMAFYRVGATLHP